MTEPNPTWITRRRFVLSGMALPISIILSACRPQVIEPSSTTSPGTTDPSTIPGSTQGRHTSTTTLPASSTTSSSTTTVPPRSATGPTTTALLDPSAHGWPDATNTGVPARTQLHAIQGSLGVRDDGIRLDDAVQATRPASGSTVWGPVILYPDRTEIHAANLVGRLRQESSYGIYVTSSKLAAWDRVTDGHVVATQGRIGTPKVFFRDCEINAKHMRAAAFGGWLEFVRCNIYGGEDAVDMQTETHFRDCYLHDMTRLPGSHNDIFQCGGAVNASAVHCTLLSAKSSNSSDPHAVEFPDGWYDPMNAVLMIGDYGGRISDVRIEDCLVDGGNWTFNDNWRGDHSVKNIIVRRNRFGRHFRYGTKSIEGPAWVWEDNVWDDSGEVV